ncbi:MAG: amino acid ABC transporter substrate-binding protein [Alphaproteobacteria bacterium]|nr:amino acid ABC transporter substrate-binding protein [Alphaproteobacteria bacterium]
MISALKASFFAASAAALLTAAAGAASAATLDRVRQDGTLRIAFRQDAPPFSYKDSNGKAAGYVVDLCRAVAKHLVQQLKLPSLKLAYVPVNAVDRFDAITGGKADLLCEATTATLARRASVDFSISTFVDGASLMIMPDGPRDLASLAGKKVGVLGGTTTEEALRNTLAAAKISADVVPAKSHAEGLAMLQDGRTVAYFGDRSILMSLVAEAGDNNKPILSEAYLTVEPYALALPRGDEAFRLEVDRALSHIYRSGEIQGIFESGFGPSIKPSPILQTLYLITGLPD